MPYMTEKAIKAQKARKIEQKRLKKLAATQKRAKFEPPEMPKDRYSDETVDFFIFMGIILFIGATFGVGYLVYSGIQVWF